jgi:hypothetical protein
LASAHPASNPKRFALCGSARIANASAFYPWPKGTGFYGYFDKSISSLVRNKKNWSADSIVILSIDSIKYDR